MSGRPNWLRPDRVDEGWVMAGHGLDEPRISPDCVAGKHKPSCPGDAWDEVEDRRVDCECTCHG